MRISRRGAVAPFVVMDVMESARIEEAKGRHIIHMEVGQPSTSAPKSALKKLSMQLSTDALGYTVSKGLPELRQKICDLYLARNGVTISPDRIIITAGASTAFQLAFTCLFEVGECVAIGAPGYPSYRNILQAMGNVVVEIETGVESNFNLTADHLVDIQDVAGCLVASPANPTGSIISKVELSKLIDHCQAHDIALISDEIYHGLEYGERSISALELSDDVFVINSFSKYFSMTGWRLGWLVVPKTHARQAERLAQNLFICAPHVAQKLAIDAMDCKDELAKNRSVYVKNRDALQVALPKIGLDKFSSPDGAYYFYIDIRDYSENSAEFCAEILEKAGVAVTPGLDFDPKRGHHFMRLSYARSHEDILEGIKRLQIFMQPYLN